MTSHIDPGGELDRGGVPAGGRLPAWLRAALAALILLGLGLRVWYPGTTVFCDDQARACALAEDVAAGHWQSGGLVNSGGFRNLPGFVYLLAGVWRLWGDPLALVWFTAAVNVLAVVASFFLMRRWIGAAAAWWATAFLATAPWAIHYSRWIWAQDLLFPAALCVWLFLWQWVGRGRKWAALGVVLSLAVLVHIHLVGVVAVLAAALLVVWCRPKLPLWPVAIGVAIAAASVVPYLLEGQLGAPKGDRVGYQHFWRVVPSAAMSVTGLDWRLEFRGGYPALADSLGWRRWPYEAVMCLPVLLLAAGGVMGLRRLWRQRRAGRAARREPTAMVTALVVLIPLAFVVTAIRTSPTYVPMWYPLPFVLIGLAAVRLSGTAGRRRRWTAAVLIGVMCVQLAFFVEQLGYVRGRGGVPGSPLGRSYAAMCRDVAVLAGRVDAGEVLMLYEGPSSIQGEPAAYLLRRARWAGAAGGRAVVRLRWGGPCRADELPEGADPPAGAYLVRPWRGPQQSEGRVPLRPPPAAAAGGP